MALIPISSPKLFWLGDWDLSRKSSHHQLCIRALIPQFILGIYATKPTVLRNLRDVSFTTQFLLSDRPKRSGRLIELLTALLSGFKAIHDFAGRYALSGLNVLW